MQAFFSNFFQRPSHPVWNALRLGMVSLLRTRPALQLLATRGPWAAKTKHDGSPQPTARFRSVAPNRSGVIAEPSIELHQRVGSIFLVIGRKILPIAPYFSSPHVE